MENQSFEANVRVQTNLATIDLIGEINSFADDALDKAYEEAQSQNPSIIALNFTEVDYINSTGIALIVELLAQARKSHKKIVVFGLSDHYLEIFRITRLADFMDIYEDETAALAKIVA